MESRKRSIVKALFWRVIGIIVLGAITWILTKDSQTTTSITLMFHTINLVLYYYHERLWERIDWGLLKMSELSVENQAKVMDKLRKLEYAV